MDKCPYCGSRSIGRIVHPRNLKYCVLSVDDTVNPAAVDLGTIMPLEAIGCSECGGVVFINSLIKKPKN